VPSAFHYTSTHLFGAVSCEAGIAALDVYERDNAFAKMQRAGERRITTYDQKISFSGPSTHPTVLYDNDPDSVLMERFCYEAAKRGALFHPRFWSFLSAAHDDGSIDETIEIVGQSFAAIARP
jgi:glutamate-1-semialdehyde aminotransferase